MPASIMPSTPSHRKTSGWTCISHPLTSSAGARWPNGDSSRGCAPRRVRRRCAAIRKSSDLSPVPSVRRGSDPALWPLRFAVATVDCGPAIGIRSGTSLSHTLRSARSHIFAPDLVMGYQSGYYLVSVFTGYRPRFTWDRSDSSRRSRDHPCRSSKIVHLFRKRDWFTVISCPTPPRCRPLSPRTRARASPSAPPAYP